MATLSNSKLVQEARRRAAARSNRTSDGGGGGGGSGRGGEGGGSEGSISSTGSTDVIDTGHVIASLLRQLRCAPNRAERCSAAQLLLFGLLPNTNTGHTGCTTGYTSSTPHLTGPNAGATTTTTTTTATPTATPTMASAPVPTPAAVVPAAAVAAAGIHLNPVQQSQVLEQMSILAGSHRRVSDTLGGIGLTAFAMGLIVRACCLPGGNEGPEGRASTEDHKGIEGHEGNEGRDTGVVPETQVPMVTSLLRLCR